MVVSIGGMGGLVVTQGIGLRRIDALGTNPKPCWMWGMKYRFVFNIRMGLPYQCFGGEKKRVVLFFQPSGKAFLRPYDITVMSIPIERHLGGRSQHSDNDKACTTCTSKWFQSPNRLKASLSYEWC